MATTPHKNRRTIRIVIRKPQLPRWLRPVTHLWQYKLTRVGLVIVAVVIVAVEVIPLVRPYVVKRAYALGNAESLLEQKDPVMAAKLGHNDKESKFEFNANYNPEVAQANQAGGGGPQISASSYDDASRGLSVTDPINGVDFTLKPTFDLLKGKQDGNRLIYPLMDGTGWLIYTMQAGGVKEDIVLDHANGDRMVLNYDLDLGESMVARMQRDGSIGVYGTELPLNGSVSTGSEKDAALLQKARQKAPKTKLLFTIPAPIAYEANRSPSSVSVHYELKGTRLKTVAANLKKGSYPLTIDPTVTVNSTSDLFRDTNPESNVDFNATTGSIARGAVTGGVLVSSGGVAWTTNGNNLSTARFLHGATIYDDYAYVAGGAGANSTSNLTSVEFAKLSNASPSIGAWAGTTALPTALSRFQLLAYNGYLYAIGGATSTTDCSTVSSAVYYTRMQTTGQLSGTWNTASTTLPAGVGVCGLGAAVYNGKVYVTGGRTGSAANTGVTTVAYATLLPNGDVGSWTTDDSALPLARYDHDTWIYNGYIYVIGGNLNGTLTNTVLYAPLASDGSIYGTTWKTASNFGTARSNMGSTFSATSDGYMYVQGGCNTFTSQSCTSIRSETQVAQINADGSLGPWSDMATSLASLSRVGNSIVVWRGNMYSFAGCTSMNAGISCATGAPTLNTQSYAVIASPGQVGPVNTTTSLPVATFAHGTVINNGFLYSIGGCITNSCQTGSGDTTGNVNYVALNADGTLGGTWTTDSTNRLNGATGLAWYALSVYNNYLYASGGYTNNGGGATGSVASATIFYVKLNSNGSLTGAWTASTGTAGLTAARYSLSSVAYRGFLFVFGGCTNAGGGAGCTAYSSAVDRFTLNATTGAPGSRSAQTALPTAKAAMAPALYNGYVYLAGGATSASGQTNIIFYARITDAGAISSWINGTSGTTGHLVNTLRRADAVAMNGYIYVLGGHNGATGTTYGDIEIAKIDLSTGDIPNNFTNSVIQVTQRWDEHAAFSNGYAYITGGCNSGNPPATCSVRSAVVEYVEIFNAGNKGTSAWANGTSYTTNRTSTATAVYNGYIYIAGGCTNFTVGTSWGNTFCGATNNTTAYASLNPDGSINSWTGGTNLPAARGSGCLVATASTLYYFGGEDAGGTATAIVYYSTIGANGVPSGWTQASQGLPAARSWISCGLFSNRVYITGGQNGSGTSQTSVYHTPDLSAGGDITATWPAADTSFTGARSDHVSVIAGGYLYVIGGDDGGSVFMDVQFIQLDPTNGGTTGSWAYSRELPQGLSYSTGIAANGYIYLIGGRSAPGSTGCVATTYIASVNSTGRLSEWSQGVNNLNTSARFGVAGAFYNGYYYALGGDDCTSIVSTNPVQYGGQQSQAMKTFISKYADLAGNGTPRKFVTYLTNAVNNGVDIEKWRLQYKSSAEAANTWGALTTVYPLTNQAQYVVSALDGSSTDIKISRWFFFGLDINMEQSFTFTDDTKPTISQYAFYYSPPPQKRLMHGRDFRDQSQQGLDAYPH